MGKLDIAIVILIGLGGFSCFRAGFTRSVWGIAAIAAGVFAASYLWRDLSPVVQGFVKHEGLAKWVSIIVIAAGVSVAMDALFERLQKIIDRGVLGWINSGVGAAFGVASSSILIGCLLLALEHYDGDMFQEAIANSRFAPRLLEIGNEVFDFGKEVIKEQADKM
ncbi:MAG: CvpA family protein [Candidatus Poribacteria bacterium]|nr:CvpA family protein [Candidatus Poribacteria bacterium]